MIAVGDVFVPAGGDESQAVRVTGLRAGYAVDCAKVVNGVTFDCPEHVLLDPLRWRKLESYFGSRATSGGTPPLVADHVVPTPRPPAPPALDQAEGASLSGRKFDGGKARYDLIPSTALAGLAEVLRYGANKYSDDNWSKVPDARRRYYAAMLRHLESWRGGEWLDAESGLPHLDHAAACLCFLRALDAGQTDTAPVACAAR